MISVTRLPKTYSFIMDETINQKILWNNAGKAGAVLGIATAALMFIDQALSGLQTIGLLLRAVIWVIRFVGCILLMRYFMQRLCARYSGVTNSDTFRYGMIIAFLSGLIYSAFILANILIISPDLIDKQFDLIIQSYSSFLDSNTLSSVEQMKSIYPQTAFFSQLIYCFLYGTALSAILSRYIPKTDPFANYTGTDNDSYRKGNGEN